MFRYKADRLPVAVITLLFLADVLVYFTVESKLVVLAWFILMIWPKACICSWNHHHQHCNTFSSTFLNRLLEIVYAFHTGITTNAWVLHHNLGHHVNYLDQTKDESAWRHPDGHQMGVTEYTWYVALRGYLKAYQVGKRYPRYQPSFIGMGFLVFLLVVALLIYNWYNGLVLFAIPMLIGYTITVWHTYYHHAGLDADDHLEASYNITHKWYNRLTGNLGFHTAHHMKQSVHWSDLPELHKKIEKDIPKELYRKPCIPFRWMPAK